MWEVTKRPRECPRPILHPPGKTYCPPKFIISVKIVTLLQRSKASTVHHWQEMPTLVSSHCVLHQPNDSILNSIRILLFLSLWDTNHESCCVVQTNSRAVA